MRYAWLMAVLLAASGAGQAQVADPLAKVTDAGDRAVMAEAAAAMGSRKPDIVQLDAVLAKLPRPTRLRGMVQAVRASVLSADMKDTAPAVAAVEEALRLLPDEPWPKLVASYIFTFSGSPQRAADLWMEASRLSPEVARMSDRYLMMALIGRLTELADHARADRLSARLGEIGFSAALAPERSNTALARTREAMRNQQEDDALLAVTAIGNPEDLLTLYIDRRYASLWPRIAEWAGADLAGQSRRYLEELRGDWRAADNFVTAAPYARALLRVDAFTAVDTLFLPMFDRLPADPETPHAARVGAERLAPVIVRALARLGRTADAHALLEKLATLMSRDEGGNALNVDAAYLTLATMEADWPQVVTRADTFLAKARSLGDNIDRGSMLQVQAWRACALSRTGRTAEAQQASAEVMLAQALVQDAAMIMLTCRGDADGVRALLIARLADETTRDWALRFVQPKLYPAPEMPLDRLTQPVEQAARTAPDVVAAANKVGRILPQPLYAGLPAGFEPFEARAKPRPPAPGVI